MCPLETPKYKHLVEDTADPLYQTVIEYLAKKELGLLRWAQEPLWWIQQAIIFVATERERLRERDRKWSEDSRPKNWSGLRDQQR